VCYTESDAAACTCKFRYVEIQFKHNGKKTNQVGEITDPTDPPFTHEMDPSSGSKH
jgi:hypothetical protein